MRRLYENWPIAVADRLRLLPKRRHLLYRVRISSGKADLIARSNGCDVRTITEIWIGGFYDKLVRPANEGNPSVMIDIGANCGYFSVYIALRHPGTHIVCFEPEAANLLIATANFALNGISADLRSEAVVPGAATSVTLNLSADPRLHTTIPPAEAAEHGIDTTRYSGSVVQVAAVNINDVIRQVGRSRIALLKIDVEGLDLDLLTSIEPNLLRRIDCVAVETEGRDLGPAIKHLEAAGFRVTEDAGLLFGSRE